MPVRHVFGEIGGDQLSVFPAFEFAFDGCEEGRIAQYVTDEHSSSEFFREFVDFGAAVEGVRDRLFQQQVVSDAERGDRMAVVRRVGRRDHEQVGKFALFEEFFFGKPAFFFCDPVVLLHVSETYGFEVAYRGEFGAFVCREQFRIQGSAVSVTDNGVFHQ